MTIKQCNSCKKMIYVKELGERCFLQSDKFMKSKPCDLYENGEINQRHKEIFQKLGREYPFTELGGDI